MYITVPMRKQKNQKYQKKHQESIFKEIQYNTLFQKFNQEDQLKKSNGFVAFRQKVIKDDRQMGSMRNSYSFIRHGSLSSQQWKKHRPSVSSIVSSKEKNHMFSRTVGEFFDRKKIQPQPDPIHQKPQERESQQKHEQNSQPNNFTPNIQPSSFQSIMKAQPVKPPRIQKTKKIKPTTLLDLKVQSIERLIRKSGKNHLPEDFIAFKQNDDKVVKKKGWEKFFDDMMRNTMSDKLNQTSTKDKMQKLRRTATSHNLRKKEQEENAIQEIISVKKKRDNVENPIQQIIQAKNKHFPINKSFISRSQHPSPSQSPSKPNPIQQQNMRQFFSFVKGHHPQDEFSSKMSLNLYRKSKPKFYILQNSEQTTKQSLQYKKITIESFKNCNPGSVLAFLYLEENHYKLRNRKDQKNDMMREVVP